MSGSKDKGLLSFALLCATSVERASSASEGVRGVCERASVCDEAAGVASSCALRLRMVAAAQLLCRLLDAPLAILPASLFLLLHPRAYSDVSSLVF